MTRRSASDIATIIIEKVLELTWDRLPMAVVHLVAPEAFLMPPLGAEAGDLPGLDAGAGDGWDGAAAFWYPLP